MGQAIQAQCKQSDLKAMDFHSQEKDLNNISAVIDFSSPDGFIACANYCIENTIPLISGTTGLSEEHLLLTSSAKKSIPILISSNMSLGIANLKRLIKEYLLSISTPSKCSITEIHHISKKDSPSGTALEICRFLEGLSGSKIDGPIENKTEMGSSWPAVIALLKQDPIYQKKFKKCFDKGITINNVKK